MPASLGRRCPRRRSHRRLVAFDVGTAGVEVIDGNNHPPIPTSVKNQLLRLKPYLCPDAIVEFRVCKFGSGEKGDVVLQGLADLLGLPVTGPMGSISSWGLIGGLATDWKTAYPKSAEHAPVTSFWRGVVLEDDDDVNPDEWENACLGLPRYVPGPPPPSGVLAPKTDAVDTPPSTPAPVSPTGTPAVPKPTEPGGPTNGRWLWLIGRWNWVPDGPTPPSKVSETPTIPEPTRSGGPGTGHWLWLWNMWNWYPEHPPNPAEEGTWQYDDDGKWRWFPLPAPPAGAGPGSYVWDGHGWMWLPEPALPGRTVGATPLAASGSSVSKADSDEDSDEWEAAHGYGSDPGAPAPLAGGAQTSPASPRDQELIGGVIADPPEPMHPSGRLVFEPEYEAPPRVPGSGVIVPLGPGDVPGSGLKEWEDLRRWERSHGQGTQPAAGVRQADNGEQDSDEWEAEHGYGGGANSGAPPAALTGPRSDEEQDSDEWEAEHGYGMSTGAPSSGTTPSPLNGDSQTTPGGSTTPQPEAPFYGPDGWPVHPRWDPDLGVWVDPVTGARWNAKGRSWTDPDNGSPLTPPGDNPPQTMPDGGIQRSPWDPWARAWIDPATGAHWDPDAGVWRDPNHGNAFPPDWTGPVAPRPEEGGPFGGDEQLAYDPAEKRWYDPFTGAFWDPENQQWYSPWNLRPYCPGDPLPGVMPPLLGPYLDPIPPVWDPGSESWTDPLTGAHWDPDSGTWVDPLTGHTYSPDDPKPRGYGEGGLDRPLHGPSGAKVPPCWDPEKKQWYDPETGQHYDPSSGKWYTSPDDHGVDEDRQKGDDAEGAVVIPIDTPESSGDGSETDSARNRVKIFVGAGAVTAVAAAAILLAVFLPSSSNSSSNHSNGLSGQGASHTKTTTSGSAGAIPGGSSTSPSSASAGGPGSSTASGTGASGSGAASSPTSPSGGGSGGSVPATSPTAPPATTPTTAASFTYNGTATFTLSNHTGNCGSLPDPWVWNGVNVHGSSGQIMFAWSGPPNGARSYQGPIQPNGQFQTQSQAPPPEQLLGDITGKALTGQFYAPTAGPGCAYKVQGSLS